MVVIARRLPRKVQAEVRKTFGLPAPGKYGNEKVRCDGHKFDSLKERDRYLVLLMRQKLGEISGLEIHPRFKLDVEGQKVCVVIPDFKYLDQNGTVTVEDVKSKATITRTYRIKKKLLRAILGINIREIL